LKILDAAGKERAMAELRHVITPAGVAAGRG
jgi:hypothetical protein